MVFSRQLKHTRTLGHFPVTITLNDQFSRSDSVDLICSTLEERVPLYFSGQRCPVFDLGEGSYLRAKGWAYRRIDYKRWHKTEFKDKIPRSFGEDEPLEVRRGNIRRPLPKRFMGASGHYIGRQVDERGILYEEKSEPRPYGAMVLGRAKQEHEIAQKVLDLGKVATDTPVGHFTFDRLPFKSNGVNIPCGGYLCLSSTPYDIRAIEFLAYCENSDLIKKLGLNSIDFPETIIAVGVSMGKTLRNLHNDRITHFCPHPDNFKILPRSAYHVSLVDLDNASENNNSEQFLGRMVLDLETLFDYGILMFSKGDIYDLPEKNRVDFDNHLRYKRLLEDISRKTKETNLDNLSAEYLLFSSLQFGYFGINSPALSPREVVYTPKIWFKSNKPVSKLDNTFINSLRAAHKL